MEKSEKKRKPKRRRGRGEGGVSYREDQKLWEGNISLGFDAEGKRIRKRVYAQTKSEVMDRLAELRAEHKSGKAAGAAQAGASSMTVGQLMARWLAARKPKDSPTTHESRSRHIDLHINPRIGPTQLVALDPLAVDHFYSVMREDGVGAHMVEAVAATLRAACRYAVKLGLIKADPTQGAEKPRRPKKEMHCLTPQAARALLEAAKPLPIYPLLALALGTGCRQGELLALEWGDIDLEKGTLTVRRTLVWTKARGAEVKPPKTDAGRRTITLPAFALDAINAHRAARAAEGRLNQPVFATKSGRYQSRRNVLDSFYAVVDRVNDPHRNRAGGRPKKDAPPEPPRVRTNLIPDGVNWHSLRHSCASLLLSAGCSIKALSVRLGHSKASTSLNLYGHLLPNDDERLAATLGGLLK